MAIEERRLLLLDGANIYYRAFYAIAHLSNRNGCPTNAVYGFIRILRQLERQWHPTHQVVVFDGGIPESRKKLLPEYKAHRPPTPDLLKAQIPLIEEYLHCANIASLRVTGEEADDVFAAIAVKARGETEMISVVTSDKDICQIVTDKISIISPAKSAERLGPAEVKEKWGVDPLHICDLLALTGDSVDNIDGVEGLGPKTAARLLGEWGDVPTLLAHLDSLSSSGLREKLKNNRSKIERNMDLVRLRQDLPVECDWAAWCVKPGNREKLIAFYGKLDFSTLLSELQEQTLF